MARWFVTVERSGDGTLISAVRRVISTHFVFLLTSRAHVAAHSLQSSAEIDFVLSFLNEIDKCYTMHRLYLPYTTYHQRPKL